MNVYETSQLKPRQRRTKQEMQAFYDELLLIVDEQKPMTVRQVFYQAEVRGLVEKAETGYGKVQRALMTMRTIKAMPFGWITDSTRLQRRPRTYDSIEELLESTAMSYRRAVWADLDRRIEIWIEKDALGGVVLPVTHAFDVPLMVSRGYSSATFIHAAAEEIGADFEQGIKVGFEQGIVTYVYHFGDYDPAGQDAARDIQAKLTEYAPAGSFSFEQVAITPEQIVRYGLPTRPTKQTDSRAKGFGEESVDLDALPPDVLRGLVRECIEQHLPSGWLDKITTVEAEERRWFSALVEGRRA